MKTALKYFYPELLIWTAGLLFLAVYPFSEGHFTVCPVRNAGLPFCPGCGLGMSIHYLFQMDFISSFNSHPLGAAALIIISFRIISLAKSLKHNFQYQRSRHG